MTVEMASDLEAAYEEDANECPACGHPVFQAEALLAGKHIFPLKKQLSIHLKVLFLQPIESGINGVSSAWVVNNS